MDESGDYRWLSAAVDALDASVFVKDRDLRFVFVNNGFERALGRPRAEVLGRRAIELVPPAAAELAERSDREALESGRVSRALIPIGDRTFASIKTPMPGPDGLMHQLVGVSIDVTDSLALELRNSLLAAAIGSSSDLIMTVDREGRITSVNGAGQAFLAAEEASLLGRHVNDVYPRGERVEEMFLRALVGEVIQFEDQRPERVGLPWQYLSTRASPIRMPDGSITGVVVIVRDVSDARRAELREQELGEQLAHRDRLDSLGQLAGGVAHDFNNLLAVVGLSAEQLLAGRHVDEPGRPLLNQIHAVTRRGAELTAQLLAVARRDESHVAPVDLGEVVRRADALLSRTLGEQVVRVLELTPGPCVVFGSEARLEQVVLNLAINARDAMPAGGTLTVRTERAVLSEADIAAGRTRTPGEHVLLTVEDNGTGMDQETLRHALEPFYTTKQLGHGTGLGLATVHGAVAQSGGGLWIDSSLGVGTVVHVALPLAGDQVLAGPPPLLHLPAMRTAPGQLIAVVEDEAALREVTATVLKSEGYRVAVFEDGGSLLARLPELSPDVLFTDVVLPGLSGPQIAARACELVPGLRVVFSSGYTAGLVDQEQHPGVPAELLHKPYTAAELLEAVGRAVARVSSPGGAVGSGHTSRW